MKGQALTTLLIIMFIGMTITAAASALVSINSQSTTSLQLSSEALSVAESGMEDSLLHLLRDPNFSGETLTMANGTATIKVTPGNPLTITSTGLVSSHQKIIQTTINFNSGVMTVGSWKEI